MIPEDEIDAFLEGNVSGSFQTPHISFDAISDPSDITSSDIPSSLPVTPPTGLFWIPPVQISDKLSGIWTTDRTEEATKSLSDSMGANDLFPPNEIQKQERLNSWWRETGQFIPRSVLDQMGVVGGERIPTIREAIDLEDAQRVGIVKDFLGIERAQSADPLADLVFDTPVDPSDFTPPLPDAPPEMQDIIKAADIEDLKVIQDTMSKRPADFDPSVSKAIDEEVQIREAIPELIDAVADFPLLSTIGTDFFNSLAFNLPEFASRKGFSPTEALLGRPKGSESILIRSMARIREQIVAQDPTLLARIGGSSGSTVAGLIQFVALPDPSKAAVFAKLPSAVKAAIGVGSKAGFLEAIQAPESGDTFDSRAKEIAVTTGVGVLTGATLQVLQNSAKALFKTIKDLPVSKQADKIIFNNPDTPFSKPEIISILKTLKSEDPAQFATAINFKPRKPVVSRIRPTRKGLRGGFADIEETGKLAKKIIKSTPKAKEAAVIKAAEASLRLKTQPSKAVKPTKILTRKEAFSMLESNLATGKGDDIKIIANPANKRTIQADENKIAKLKTQRDKLKAEKTFAVAVAKAKGASSKEIALAKQKAQALIKLDKTIDAKNLALDKLKEKSAIKLEQTIESTKAKIAKVREAVEFKDFLRDDAVSMITAIPKELRPAFITRANRVKSIKGVRKLMNEVEAGVDKFERKIAVGELKTTIKDIESKNRLGKVRLGKVPSPQREKLIDILDEISLKKISTQLEPPPEDVKTFGELDVKARAGREQLLGADLKSLQNVTQRLSSELAGGLEALDASTAESLRLPNERVRQLNVLTQKNIDEIDTDDIKLVVQSLQSLVQSAKLKSQLLTKSGLKPLDGALKAVTENEIAPSRAVTKQATSDKPIETKKTALKKTGEFAKKVLVLDDSHLDTLVQLSTNPNSPITKQILDTDLHEGHRNSADKLNQWIDLSSRKFKEIGFTDSDQISEEVITTLGGKKVSLTKDHLIKLELHSRSPENLRAILRTKGWEIGGKQIDYPLDAQGNDKIDRLAEIKKAVSVVRDDDVLTGIADWTNELTPIRGEAINETSKALNGFDIARDPLYTSRPAALPLKVEGGKDISAPPEQEGRYLPRTGGTHRLKLDKWSDDFLNGIESDANLFGMAIPLRNARVLVSSDQFQTAMKAAGRDMELKNIITILRRVQGVSTSRGTLDVFGSKLQRGFATTALGFRVSTIGAQSMSYPAAFSEIQSFMKPMGSVGFSKGVIQIQEDSPLMSLRWKGRRIGVEVGTSASFDAFDALMFGKTKSIANKGMKPLVKGDQFAIWNIYDKGVVPEILTVARNGKNVNPLEWEGEAVADLPVLKEGSREFRYAAARRLEYVVRRTQPMFDMLDRSVASTNPDLLSRQVTGVFRTPLEAQENIVIRATDAFAKSPKTATDKLKLTKDLSSVVTSAFAVAVWKNGLKWAIRGGIASTLAAFGIFTFDDKRERDNLAVEIGKDTISNTLAVSRIGKFLVSIGERVANRLSGDGYNWNRDTFQVPILDVLESGVDTVASVANAMSNIGLIDEFVDPKTKKDKEQNKKFEDKIVNDAEDAIRSSYDFGVRITGSPFLAPVQEFLRPALVDSEIKIIREVTFGDIDSPQEFSERVFNLFERKTELIRKSKKKRLTRQEDQMLSILEKFTSKMNTSAETIKQTESQSQRRLRFRLLEGNIKTVEGRVKQLEAK
jgi:hypothetical protein